jgi:hypothetical protein
MIGSWIGVVGVVARSEAGLTTYLMHRADLKYSETVRGRLVEIETSAR